MRSVSIRRVVAVSWLVLTLLVGLALPAIAAPSAYPLKPFSQPGDEAIKQRALDTYARLPLYFIANQGQMDESVGYYVQGGGHAIYFTAEEMVMALDEITLRLRFVGAKAATQLVGTGKTAATVNYLIGNDPQKWRTDIPTYGEVVYHELYPGIDLRYAGQTGALKYTFVVDPGADVSQIRLAYQGVDDLYLDETGDLVIQTARGELRDTKPYVYQEIGGRRVEIETAFALYDRHVYGFTVRGDYDPRYPLVIDPTLLYSTYLGGGGDDTGYGIAVDGDGNAYVTGETTSEYFPTQNSYQGTLGGGAFDTDAFVTKIDTTQTYSASLVYSTYLGGSTSDFGYSIAVDGADHAYVTGITYSSDFPRKNAFDNDMGGMDDAFVTKLNAAGNGLLYSTYLGGSVSDEGLGIAVEGAGHAYVTGWTVSDNFPTKNPYEGTCEGCPTTPDAFVTKIDTTKSGATSLVYSTYLGGGDYDSGYGIAVDGAGNACVTGYTGSTNFPTKNPYQTYQGLKDAFVTKLNATGNALLYSTYLGGSNYDYGYGIAVDGDGHAYVTGSTYSSNFPTPNYYDNTLGGSVDAFVTKIDPTQSGAASLLYSTYLGGSSDDEGQDIAVDWTDTAYVTGYTDSTDFPTTPGTFDTTCGTDGACDFDGMYYYEDAFVTRLSADGSTLIYPTYLGGSDDDYGYGIAVDGDGNAYVTGKTWSSIGFPLKNAFDDTPDTVDAFVTKLGLANIVVNADTGQTYAGIQAGINAALPGEKVLAYPGDYNEDVTLISGVGVHGQGQPTIDGPGTGPVVTADQSNIDATTGIFGFRITGGSSVVGGVTALAQGGGIYVNNNASPTIENNVIEGNSSSDGGGIYVGSGNPNISNNAVQGNNSTNTGGGIYVGSGNPSISNNTVQNNISTNPGGGIYLGGGSSTISNNVIQGNTSNGNGGGIYIGSGDPNVSNNVIYDNSATTGGGIYVDGGASASGSVDSAANPTISSNTLCGNDNFNLYKNGGALDAPGNWWGTNSPVSGTDYNANVDPLPFVTLKLTIEPPIVKAGDTATVTVTLRADGYQAAEGTAISLTIVSGGTFPGGATTVAVNTTNGLAHTPVNVTSDDGLVITAISPYNDGVIITARLGAPRVYLPNILR